MNTTTTLDERWIVRYRRYSSDQWLEEPFTTRAAAEKFKREYLYDRGFEAQATIEHFVKAAANSVKDSEQDA